jgi:two-component system, cell cycle response regulator
VVFYAAGERVERPRLRYRGSESRALRDGLPVVEGGARSGMTGPLHGDGRVLGVLRASLDLPEVLSRVLDAARDLGDAAGSAVWLLVDDEEEAEIALRSGEIGPAPGTRFALSPPLREHMVERRETLLLENVRTQPLLPPEVRDAHPVASAIAVPLVAEHRVIGALAVGHVDPRRYRREEVRLQERLAQQAAIAIANARLQEEIRALSLTDALIGILNRRHLNLFLEKEFAADRDLYLRKADRRRTRPRAGASRPGAGPHW